VTLRNIPKDKVISRIRLENGWWESGQIDEFYARMKPRAYFERFHGLVKEVQTEAVRRAPILMGPRRVGKTVMLLHLTEALIKAGLDPDASATYPQERDGFEDQVGAAVGPGPLDRTRS